MRRTQTTPTVNEPRPGTQAYDILTVLRGADEGQDTWQLQPLVNYAPMPSIRRAISTLRLMGHNIVKDNTGYRLVAGRV